MRPTISLAVIAKNEEENVSRLLKSVEGCFDAIEFVDTGSTDKTVEVAKSLGANVSHFPWINDFSAARNFSFDQVKTDYVMWMDLDDVLLNKEAFIDFRDNSLRYFDYVLAAYNYAIDKDGKPIISFMRERILKVDKKPRWNYFVHEGVKPMPGSKMHYCTSWSVNHLRTQEDMAKDKSRNLQIFEQKKLEGKLDGRLTFYYGKELFENQQFEKAFKILLEAGTMMDLEHHDRVLCIQYTCYAGQQWMEQTKETSPEKMMKIVDLAQKGLLLQPDRAEFHNIIAEFYMKMGRLNHALPYYAAAANGCVAVQHAGGVYATPLHTFKPLYQEHPKNKVGQILYHLGKKDEAKRVLKESVDLYKSEEARLSLLEIDKLEKIDDYSKAVKCDDIVFTCPPQTAYPFDEELYKSKGMGGSETALIEMAKWLRKLTGRRTIVFNMRETSLMADSGVEYVSTNHLKEYFSRFEPAVHIAWRHNERVTNGPSYLWCHDLMIPGVEMGLNQDRVLCLTQFHKDFLSSSQNVPKDRILLTRNGIEPSRFTEKPDYKDPMHIVFASSPDRGLKECIEILDRVRKKHPVHLSVFYGRENLRKYGQADLANLLDKMILERTWIKDAGFVEQKQMTEMMKSAAVWCHPTHFIETFCITALEMTCLGIFPITRRWGGLGDTLADAEKKDQAILFDFGPDSDEEKDIWAAEVCKAIETKAWERVSDDPEKYAWSGVASEWVKMFGL